MIQNDVLDTAKMEGRALGRAEDKAEGRTESIRTIAKRLKEMGMPTTRKHKISRKGDCPQNEKFLPYAVGAAYLAY